jgi:hypothetical protein
MVPSAGLAQSFLAFFATGVSGLMLGWDDPNLVKFKV